MTQEVGEDDRLRDASNLTLKLALEHLSQKRDYAAKEALKKSRRHGDA